MSQGQTLPPGVLTITGDIPKATGHWIELSRYVALETDVRELRAANARLTAAASGRGMVSEMDGLPEIAVLVMGLYARAERAEAALKQARALLNKLQWQATSSAPVYGDWLSCAFCGGDHPNHKSNCDLAALLAPEGGAA